MNPELINISQTDDSKTDKRQNQWSPVFGPEFESYVAGRTPDHQDRLRTETMQILSACAKPGIDTRSAGLVLGYVQSGKTSSFTAATALAHDNNYKCVIIIGGTTNILLNQTVTRFKKDLKLESENAVNRWLITKNPTNDNAEGKAVNNLFKNNIEARNEGRRSVIKQIPLIFVMKHGKHLDNLNNLLEEVAGVLKTELSGLSILIVDDEAHMHTPNIANTNANPDVAPSRVYGAMKELRSYLPSHTLLQYTATPQANLVAAIDDEFSPEFVILLGTGPDYAGGKQLFIDNIATQTIKSIPATEVLVALAAGTNDVIPKSLSDAIASYLIVCASDYIEAEINSRPPHLFSMLVHADVSNNIQKNFNNWLTNTKTSWMALLNMHCEDRNFLINETFKHQYDDLSETAQPCLRPLDVVMKYVPKVLNLLNIQMVNQAGNNEVNFNLSPYHIINGGNLLGVGFTVEGLITTHMMRNPGNRQQIDTIQQRGRFFGYRKPWINRMRIWLQDSVRDSFKGYVKHEEYLRESLYNKVIKENKSLREWKRVLRLDPGAAICRRNAIKMEVTRFKTNSGWVSQTYRVPDANNRNLNLELVNTFMNDGEHPIQMNLATPRLRGQSTETTHYYGETTIKNLRILLASYVFHEENRASFEVIRLLLEDFESNPQYQIVDVFDMAHGHLPKLRRRQVGTGPKDEGRVDLQQGDNDGKYLGDREVRMNGPKDSNARITLQIYRLDHGPRDNEIHERNVIYIAISLPAEIDEEGCKFVTAK